MWLKLEIFFNDAMCRLDCVAQNNCLLLSWMSHKMLQRTKLSISRPCMNFKKHLAHTHKGVGKKINLKT